MIQSGKFDSSYMDIKKTANLILNFIIKRLIEIIGISISFLGILILLSLISYSPNDPNFIFPENTEINNFIGFKGSYTSDLLFQSVGQISYLIPITFIFTGISIIKSKDFFLIFENTFYIIIYCLFGTLFFTYFYEDSFTLYINGNGGFVGKYLNEIFVNNILNLNQDFIYYLLIIITIFIFLISINLNFKTLKSFLKKIFSKKDKVNYQNKNEIISEYIPQEEIKNLIQEDLPFIKADKLQQTKVQSFKLPSIDLLKISKREKRNSDNENVDPNFLKKFC